MMFADCHHRLLKSRDTPLIFSATYLLHDVGKGLALCVVFSIPDFHLQWMGASPCISMTTENISRIFS